MYLTPCLVKTDLLHTTKSQSVYTINCSIITMWIFRRRCVNFMDTTNEKPSDKVYQSKVAAFLLNCELYKTGLCTTVIESF